MTEGTKKIVMDLLVNAHINASNNANRARRAYRNLDMSFVVNEAGETRQKILDGYEKRETDVTAAIKEVDPNWSPR